MNTFQSHRLNYAMVMNDIKISFLIPPKIFCIRPSCEGSVFYSSLLLWGLGLYMCFQKHRSWTMAGHTEFLPCLDLELTYVLPIHSLLARTNHMAPPKARDPRNAVLHELQIKDEHVTLPSKTYYYLALSLQYLSVSHDLQNAIYCPQSSASCSCLFIQWCGSCRWGFAWHALPPSACS